MTTGSGRPEGSASAAALQEWIRGRLRRSLDRAKFWNTCAQFSGLSPDGREFSRAQRDREAEHRLMLKRLRREVTAWEAMTTSGHEVAAMQALDREEAALTEAVTSFLASGQLEPRPTWIPHLLARSPWLDRLITSERDAE